MKQLTTVETKVLKSTCLLSREQIYDTTEVYKHFSSTKLFVKTHKSLLLSKDKKSLYETDQELPLVGQSIGHGDFNLDFLI